MNVTAIKRYQRDTTSLSVTKAICHSCNKAITDDEPINWEKCRCGDRASHWPGSPQPFCLNCKPLHPYDDNILNEFREPLKRICRHCGRIYYVGRTIGGHRFYCSVRCAKDVQIAITRNKRAEMRTEIVCLHCNKRFFGSRNDQRYCSAACKQKAYRQRGKQTSGDIQAQEPVLAGSE